VLMRPAQRGFSIVVEYLLDNNADPNIEDHVRKNVSCTQCCTYVIAVNLCVHLHHTNPADED